MKNEEKIIIKKDFFIRNIKGDVTAFYEVVKKLGEGSYGKVYKVKHKISGDIRAMKEIKKDKLVNPEGFKKEVEILSMLDHPYIVRLFEVIENEQYFYVIMELCTGGELLSRMEKGHYKEKEAAVLFSQLLSAINYCHTKGIVHRDLKPGNILFADESKDAPIKIIDFGLSVLLKDPNIYKLDDSNKPDDKLDLKRMTTQVGTMCFISPEIIKGNYNEKCDVWACGVILYILLCGYPPFAGSSDKEVYQNISSIKYEFHPEHWKNISKHAKDLIKSMFLPEKKRISASEALSSKWLNSKLKKKDSEIGFNYEKIKQYKTYTKFKQAVLLFIASRLKTEEYSDIMKIFCKIDEYKTGMISFDEFKFFLINEQNLEIIGGDDDNEIKENFLSIDVDRNNKIDFTEFLAANLDESIYLQKEKLEEAFNAFDANEKGIITREDIINALKMDKIDDAKLAASSLIEPSDINKDGTIDFNEFCRMMENK